MKTETIGKKVVVTTDKDRRGVFFGTLESVDGDIVVLSSAQMCVYWSEATRSVLGLSSIGPQEGSRISPVVPQIELNGVTSVALCTDEAVEQWNRLK